MSTIRAKHTSHRPRIIVADLVAGVASYNFFLRFLELYWVGPLVQDRQVYATVESLWIDFWCCLRTFPKPAKKDTPELNKGQVKVYQKDKVSQRGGGARR